MQGRSGIGGLGWDPNKPPLPYVILLIKKLINEKVRDKNVMTDISRREEGINASKREISKMMKIDLGLDTYSTVKAWKPQ